MGSFVPFRYSGDPAGTVNTPDRAGAGDLRAPLCSELSIRNALEHRTACGHCNGDPEHEGREQQHVQLRVLSRIRLRCTLPNLYTLLGPARSDIALRDRSYTGRMHR